MAEEANDHRGSALQATELTAGETMQIGDGSGQRVGHGSLDEAIALLLRVKFRRIGRQISHRIIPVQRIADSSLR